MITEAEQLLEIQKKVALEKVVALTGCSLENAADAVAITTTGQVVIHQDKVKEIEAREKAKEEAAEAIKGMLAGALWLGIGACCAHFAKENLGSLSSVPGKKKAPLLLDFE